MFFLNFILIYLRLLHNQIVFNFVENYLKHFFTDCVNFLVENIGKFIQTLRFHVFTVGKSFDENRFYSKIILDIKTNEGGYVIFFLIR